MQDQRCTRSQWLWAHPRGVGTWANPWWVSKLRIGGRDMSCVTGFTWWLSQQSDTHVVKRACAHSHDHWYRSSLRSHSSATNKLVEHTDFGTKHFFQPPRYPKTWLHRVYPSAMTRHSQDLCESLKMRNNKACYKRMRVRWPDSASLLIERLPLRIWQLDILEMARKHLDPENSCSSQIKAVQALMAEVFIVLDCSTLLWRNLSTLSACNKVAWLFWREGHWQCPSTQMCNGVYTAKSLSFSVEKKFVWTCH